MPTGTNVQLSQDWDAVNVGKSTLNHSAIPKTARGLDAAKAQGKVSTEIRFGAGGNPAAQSGGAIMSARKLDDATEAGTIAKVDIALSKAIMQARMAKKLNQNDLAKLINEKGTTIQQYESGKAIPNPQIIAKLEKQLGCKLPRPGKSKVAPKETTAASAAAAAMAKKTGGGVTRGGPVKRR